MEEERRTLTAQIAEQKEEMALLTKDYQLLLEQNQQVELCLQTKEQEFAKAKELQMQLEIEKELRNRCELREENERRERIAAIASTMAMENECHRNITEKQEEMNKLQQLYDSYQMNMNEKYETVTGEKKELQEMNAGLKKEIEQLHLALSTSQSNQESVEQLGRVTCELEILKQKLHDLNHFSEYKQSIDAKKVTELEEKLTLSEQQRRRLHNLVQELRGNIRVFARVRPFLPGDGYDFSREMPDSSMITRSDMNTLKIGNKQISNTTGEEKKEEYEFNFDKVFGPTCSQEYLFHEVAEFVQSALDGYHVCLFSYGQTGSGKVTL
jgi:kinesin family protein C1